MWIADLSRAAAVGERAGTPLGGLDYTESFLLAAIDTALAAQNALVAAETLDLGTVYVGALRNDPEAVARLLEPPARAVALFGLVVGYPDRSVPTAVKPRLPQQGVLHHETYSASVQSDAIVRHDATARAFRVEQGLSAEGWTDLLIARLRNVAALKGRHPVRDVLEGPGVRLGGKGRRRARRAPRPAKPRLLSPSWMMVLTRSYLTRVAAYPAVHSGRCGAAPDRPDRRAGRHRWRPGPAAFPGTGSPLDVDPTD